MGAELAQLPWCEPDGSSQNGIEPRAAAERTIRSTP